jgi:hypothetical protein
MTPSLARHRPGTGFAGDLAARMGFGVALNISTTVYGLWGQVETTSGEAGRTGYCGSMGARGLEARQEARYPNNFRHSSLKKLPKTGM